MVEARGKSGGLAEIAAETNHPQVWIHLLQPGEGLEAVIGASIVDDQDLVGPPPLRQRFGELAVELRERSRFVANGDDDAQLWSHDQSTTPMICDLRVSSFVRPTPPEIDKEPQRQRADDGNRRRHTMLAHEAHGKIAIANGKERQDFGVIVGNGLGIGPQQVGDDGHGEKIQETRYKENPRYKVPWDAY